MNWLERLPIGGKVAAAPIFCGLCLVVVGGLGLYANRQIASTLSLLSQVDLPRLERIRDSELGLSRVNALLNQSLAWEGAGIKTEKIAQLDALVVERLGKYSDDLIALSSDPTLDDQSREMLKQVSAEFGKYKEAAAVAIDIKGGMVSNAVAYMTVIDEAHKQLDSSFASLHELHQQHLRHLEEYAQSVHSRNVALLLAGTLTAGLLGALLTVLASRLLSRPLRQAQFLATRMAQGDLTFEPTATAPDATGQVLRAMHDLATRVGTVVREIQGAAAAVGSASKEVASGSLDLSSRTERSATELQRTAASLQHLTVSVSQSADSARQASGLASEASSAADDGDRAVSEVVATMTELDAQAKRIREITGMIDTIAFQTNILALNAAVESARAGEQGRGFAVVAAEVRTLAQRSATAAKEIRELISASVAQVERGSQTARTAGQSMERIRRTVHSVHQTMGQISTSSGRQAEEIQLVNAAITSMEASTQQNAAMVEQASAAAASLDEQAQKLVGSVSVFRT